MPAPVLFLETASGHETDVRPEVAIDAAIKLVKTLVSAKKANSKISLNSEVRLHDCELAPGQTLGRLLAGSRNYKEEWDFLRGLAAISPIHSGFETWLDDAELIEVKPVGGEISPALIWAHLLDTGIVSFHVRKEWLQPWVNVECTALDENGRLRIENKKLRNSSLPAHVGEHCEWLKSFGFDRLPPARELWAEREFRFPGLRLLERIQEDIKKLATTGIPYEQVINTLTSLNDDAMNWGGIGEVKFSCKVADGEHDRRRQFSVVQDDLTGCPQEFGKHAYFWMGKSIGTPAGRIHFRVSQEERKFVVAYAGFKLKSQVTG